MYNQKTSKNNTITNHSFQNQSTKMQSAAEYTSTKQKTTQAIKFLTKIIKPIKPTNVKTNTKLNSNHHNS